MRGTLKILALLLAAQGAGAALFAWSGLYNIGASKDHWAVTTAFIEFGMRNAIETHAMMVGPPPDLDNPALIRRGAGHYENGCAPCHGAPAAPRNPISRHMLPAPPFMPEVVDDWTTEELYWITLNGIKMAGMPAWPARQRTDERWAVTAFLRRRAGMRAEEYRRLAFGETPADSESTMKELEGLDRSVLETCARCHGYDGNGGGGAFPRLSGQSAAYLYESLKAYADGARPSGIMQPPAAALNEADMRALAQYYATRPAPPAPAGADPRLRELGAAIAASGDPKRGVAACSGCHGPGTPRDPRYPSLAGQHAGYIADQLRLWRDGARGDTSLSKIMAAAVRGLTDEQILAAAAYYSAIPPSEDRRDTADARSSATK